jgi:hypothetical protein
MHLFKARSKLSENKSFAVSSSRQNAAFVMQVTEKCHKRMTECSHVQLLGNSNDRNGNRYA